MIDPTLYAAVSGVLSSSLRTAISSVSRRISSLPPSTAQRRRKATIPLLVPEFWWLVLNTVRLKWRHRRTDAESYLEYLDEFYTGNATGPHVAVYGDAYADERPLLADLADLRPGDTVLDVASGRGYQAAEFARRGHNVTSVELVHARAKTARDCHPECNLAAVAGDAASLPFRSDSFDIVVIFGGLHCMPEQTRLGVLKEFRRVAHRRVVIMEPRPHPGWFRRHLYAAIGQILDESQYFWEFALSDFEAHLALAGLEVVDEQRCFHNLGVVYVCDPLGQPMRVPDLSDIRETIPFELAEVI